MARIVTAPDPLPRLGARRRIARGIQRRKRRHILADPHRHPVRPRRKLHPLAHAERAGAEVRQARRLAGPVPEPAGRRVVARAVRAGQRERRPHGGCGRGDVGGPGPREEEPREEAGGCEGRVRVHGHVELVLESLAVDACVRVGVEPDDGGFEVELHFWVEGVDDGVRVPFPRLEDGLASLGDQSVGFDGVDAVVVARDEQLACVLRVGEPDLVFG